MSTEALDGVRPPAHLSPDEWSRRAASVQDALAEWQAGDPDDIDLGPIIAEAGLLYGLNEHDAEMCLELMTPPMRAPNFQAAALLLLAAEAVREAQIGWNGHCLDERNIIWVRDDCWCWGRSEGNPHCPRCRVRREEWAS